MIGVLALQGDFSKHIHILNLLGIPSIEVRYLDQFEKIDGLILPGGESTVISDLIDRNKLRGAIIELSKEKPILGTCAGLILMSKNIDDNKVDTLGILDLHVKRNAYGAQLHSFNKNLEIRMEGESTFISASFIRAPKISKTGTDIEILSTFNGHPVAVKEGKHIGLAFHPELNTELLFHNYLFKNLKESVEIPIAN